MPKLLEAHPAVVVVTKALEFHAALASVSHLSAASPCRGAGNSSYTSGTDIDGEPWAAPPSVGCDEYYEGAVTGPLSVSIAATFTNIPAGGFTVGLRALIDGATASSTWDFADGTSATNQAFINHTWPTPGNYAVTLRAFNDSSPAGVSATLVLHVEDSIVLLPAQAGGSLASSADGTKLMALGADDVVTSADSGATWHAAFSGPPGSALGPLASSADGTKLAAIGRGTIYGSTNSGANWAPIGASSWNPNHVPDLRGIACSAEGSKLVAVSCGTSSNGTYIFFDQPIYTSTNFGVTWTTTSAPNEGWLAVASSADGANLVAVAGVNAVDIGGTDGGPIYMSTNSGATWQAANAPTARWFCVCSSADGKRLAAGAFGDTPSGGIYTSSNGGRDWVLTSAPVDEGWISIVSSADGSRLVAASEVGLTPFGSIYVSQDAGMTWTRTHAPAEAWRSLACSADGGKILASGPGLFLLRFPATGFSLPPTPRLVLGSVGRDLNLSWLVPSSSFALQESPDLLNGDWTSLTTSRALNFTNLHYEVTVSPSGGTRFYRLEEH